MRFNQKKIEEIALSVLGEDGLPLIKRLYGKENISEFDLAHKTKKDIKIIRKMLYLLYNQNLVAFTRKKDKQKGWYIYYWTLVPESITFLYIKRRKELLESLKKQLGDENKELFFVCVNNCTRLNFDQALDFEFHCPECGELLTPDKLGEIEQIKKKITEIEEELANIEKEKKARKIKVKEKNKPVLKKKIIKKIKTKTTKKNKK